MIVASITIGNICGFVFLGILALYITIGVIAGQIADEEDSRYNYDNDKNKDHE